MPKVKSAAEAESIIRSYYLQVTGPHPHSFQTSKQGSEWVIRSSFRASTDADPEDHEWRIDAETGRVWFRRLSSEGAEDLRQRFFRPRDKPEKTAAPQEARPPDGNGLTPQNGPNQQQAAEGKTVDNYRARAIKTVQAELVGLMTEEVRNAARDLIAEQTKAIREAVDQQKSSIMEAVEEERAAARGRTEEIRQKMRSLAMRQLQSDSEATEHTEMPKGADVSENDEGSTVRNGTGTVGTVRIW